jgi:nicotinamidase-related amidase
MFMSQTALLIIDAQVGIIEGPIGPVWNKEKLLTTIEATLKLAREKGIPVIYIQDIEVAEPGSPELGIHPEIAPLETEKVIQKKATNAFFETELKAELDGLGVQHLVVAGCKTDYCVDTTCRNAFSLGYDVTLVADAHSTTDNKVLSAQQIIDHHNCNLHGLDNLDHFILVRPFDETVLDYKHLEYK